MAGRTQMEHIQFGTMNGKLCKTRAGHLLALPETIDRAAELRAPNQIAEYAYDLAALFSSFYETCHILTEPDPEQRASWLSLTSVVRRALELLLDLLGIEIPARM